MKKFLTVFAITLSLTACFGDKGGDSPSAPTTDTQAQSVTQTQPTNSNPSPASQDELAGYPTYFVGSDITYEPFSFRDENGQAIGFEVDLLNAIGKASKFKVTFVHSPRGELVETLNNGKFTIWSSTLSVSKERQEQVDFSEPYTDFVRQIYVLDKPENANLKTTADFMGKLIAVNSDSKSAIETATQLTGSPDNVIKAGSFALSLSETYMGKADGTLGDSRILQYYQAKHGTIKTRMIDLDDEKKNIAFAVKKGNKEVLEKINSGLRAIKADGTYDQLVVKWFGKSAQ